MKNYGKKELELLKKERRIIVKKNIKNELQKEVRFLRNTKKK